VKLRWFILIVYVAVLAWLSLTPAPPVLDTGFLDWDKLQHAGAYSLLTLLAGRAFVSFPLTAKNRWWWAVIAAVLFGGLMEIAQGLYTQTRAAELGDLVADIAGACFVYAAIVLKASFRRKP